MAYILDLLPAVFIIDLSVACSWNSFRQAESFCPVWASIMAHMMSPCVTAHPLTDSPLVTHQLSLIFSLQAFEAQDWN